MGTTMGHGAMASFPTVTLANHTSILTGCHPGHHGVLHNAWYDRSLGQQVITNSPDTWATSMQWLRPGDRDHPPGGAPAASPDVFTASVNEMCDVGADFSTFDLMRRRRAAGLPQGARRHPVQHRAVRPARQGLRAGSRRSTTTAMQQAVGIWRGAFLDVEYPLPRFMWVQLLAHRHRLPPRRPALRHRPRVDPRHRRADRRGARRHRGDGPARRHGVLRRRRPRHGGERPGGDGRLGRRTSAPRASTSATRPTGSSTSTSPEPYRMAPDSFMAPIWSQS